MSTGDEDEYLKLVGTHKPGSITRIKLINFLTYNRVEFRPGPRLNIVMGPNGTGKSTILNAICLGLGGEPKVLGRADDSREFITHGCNKALVEIELQPPDGQTKSDIFRREIDRNKGSERGNGRGASTFSINSERVTIKHVQQVVQEKYNISIGNLCTFLPQDRVGNFSGFNSKQLLEETEKSLSGSQHLYETHQSLVALEQEFRKGGNDTAAIQKKLDKLQQEFSTLEREKQRMEEREEALKLVELIQKKILWLRYDEIRESYTNVKQNRDEIKAKYEEKAKGIQPLEDQHNEVVQRKEQLDNRFKTFNQKIRKIADYLAKQSQKVDSHKDKIDELLSDILAADSDYQNAQRQIEKAVENYNKAKADLEESPDMEELKQKKREAHAEMVHAKAPLSSARQRISRLDRDIKEHQEVAHRDEMTLKKMNDEKSVRRAQIFQRDQKLAQVTKWVEENRRQFRRPVWGPVILEVTLRSKNAAAYLEQHVPNYLLKAFVVECKEDYDLIYREVRQRLRLPVQLSLVRDGMLQEKSRMYSTNKYETLRREHGVQGYLDESFAAPDAVMQALINVARVDQVLVGSEQTQESMDRRRLGDYLNQPDEGQPPNQLKAYCIFTSVNRKSYKYTSSISRFNGKPSLRVDEIPPAQMLSRGLDPAAKQRAQDRLAEAQSKIVRLQGEIDKIQSEQEELTRISQEAMARHEEAQRAVVAVTKKRDAVRRMQQKLDEANEVAQEDFVAKKRGLLKETMNRVKSSIVAIEHRSQGQTQLMDCTVKSAGTKIAHETAVAEERQCRAALLEARQQTEATKRDYELVKRQLDEIKQKTKAILNKAREEAPLSDENGDTPLREQLENLENCETVEMAEGALNEAQSKVNSIVANPDALRQYQSLQQEIEDTKEQLENMADLEAAKVHTIKEKANSWQAALQNSCDKIHILFSKYMEELNCAGQIKLKMGSAESEERDGFRGNFADWGIEIQVKFREKSKFETLSAQRQSGGERSVSTIMYLMALQDLMVSPFRCVDEINQGLDERNERLVFKRIVQNSTEKPRRGGGLTGHSGQYFLITPKLLPNLTDMEEEAVTCHIVTNGPYTLDSPLDWNPDSMIASRKRAAHDEEGQEEEDMEEQEGVMKGDEDDGVGDENSPEAGNTADEDSSTHKAKRRRRN